MRFPTPVPRRALTALVLVGAGCGAEPRPGGFTARDSAGVRIAESAAPAWGEGEEWRLAERPLVEIGTLEGPPEYQLYRVSDAARLPDGRIVVANRGSSELRVYASDGAFMRSLGTEGDGPGEFRGLSAVWSYRADSILAWDSRHARLTVFGPDGAHARDLLMSLDAGRPEIAGPLPDGSLLLQAGARTPPGPEGKVEERAMTLLHLGAEGEPLDTLGEFPHHSVVTRTQGTMIMLAPPRFAAWTRVVATDSGAWVATGRRPAVELATGAGVVRSVRWSAPPEPITDDAIATYEARFLERTDPEERERAREQLEGGDYARENAYSRYMEVDPEGNLWVMRAPGPLPQRAPPWMVFAPSGRLLGEVRIPRELRVQQIGRDWILGVRQDDVGVERVELLPLLKRGG